MIKLRGPPELKNLSLGKLCSFVQHALTKNILIYYKTLLIKNNQYQNEQEQNIADDGNKQKIEELKSQIISLLQSHRSGLSLAQIPILLKKNFSKSYNIQKLGFSKLKNLLVTMEEIILERAQGNLLKAILRANTQSLTEKIDKSLTSSQVGKTKHLKTKLANMKFHTMKNNPLDARLNDAYMSNVHSETQFNK